VYNYVNMYTCVLVRFCGLHVRLCVCDAFVYVCIYISIHSYIYTYICIYMYWCVPLGCLFVCVCESVSFDESVL